MGGWLRYGRTGLDRKNGMDMESRGEPFVR